MPRLTLRVHEPEKVTTIDAKIEIREVAQQQLKIIENSDAWKEHQKQHAGAKLSMLGTAEDKDLTDIEKTVMKETKKKQEQDSDELAPKKAAQEETPKFAYKSTDAKSEAKPAYGHSHGSGAVMGSCNCGQVFKADEHGTKPYTLNSNVSAMNALEGYKKKDEHGGTYKRADIPDDDAPRKYR